MQEGPSVRKRGPVQEGKTCWGQNWLSSRKKAGPRIKIRSGVRGGAEGGGSYPKGKREEGKAGRWKDPLPLEKKWPVGEQDPRGKVWTSSSRKKGATSRS